MVGRSVRCPTDPYSAYLEASILTAEPIELVRILYRGALDAVRDARACLAERNIPGRSKAIGKASDIVRELALSISPASAPALARSLRELYDYMGRRLLAAHAEQSDAPLVEVAGLLATMAEAWERVELPEGPIGGNATERVEMVAAEA